MSDFIQALTDNNSNKMAITGTEVKPSKRHLDVYDVILKETIEQLSTDLNVDNSEIIAQLVLVNAELDAQTIILDSIDQNTANTVGQLLAVNTELNTQTGILIDIAGDTESIKTKLDTANASLDDIEAKIESLQQDSALNLKVVTQNALVKVPHDQVQITAVNGSNDPTTVLYKLATVTVATLTITYDGSGDVSNVVVT